MATIAKAWTVQGKKKKKNAAGTSTKYDLLGGRKTSPTLSGERSADKPGRPVGVLPGHFYRLRIATAVMFHFFLFIFEVPL